MARALVSRLVVLLLLVVTPPRASAQIQATAVGTGFSQPVFGTSAPGSPGTMYVVQQGGQIRPLNLSTGAIGATFLNLSAVSGSDFLSGGERGLLGLAFHPDYQNNGRFYVHYTYENDGGTNAGHGIRVEQYTAVGGVVNTAPASVANPDGRRTVVQWSHPNNTNHNAGWIGFNPMNGTTGPNSGQLFITSGDGGGSNDVPNNAQNLSTLQGKLLRVNVGGGLTNANPAYTIPAGNMTGGGTLPEIYSYGLRNPFRAGFDRGTGNLYVGDVGQGAREEINFIANGSAGGQNFGWRIREGSIQNPAYPIGTNPPPVPRVEPIHDYIWGAANGRSVTGGLVYRGTARDDGLQPLDGTYFFGDYVSGRIWSFNYDGTTVTNFTERTLELGFLPTTDANPGLKINISSFAEDGFGNLFVIGYNTGTVYQIVPVPEPATVGLCAALGLVAAIRRKRLRG
jgi:glucose/arabinose dehydrogenase